MGNDCFSQPATSFSQPVFTSYTNPRTGTASVCRTIQISASGWEFYDTKRKRSRRIVKLQGFVLNALENLKKDRFPAEAASAYHDLIFRSDAGQPLLQRTIKREFRKLLAVAGVSPIRLYSLRHTAATLAAAAGVSVKVISDQLGHASILFT